MAKQKDLQINNHFSSILILTRPTWRTIEAQLMNTPGVLNAVITPWTGVVNIKYDEDVATEAGLRTKLDQIMADIRR